VTRRSLITGSAGVLAVLGTSASTPRASAGGIGQLRQRISLPSGVQSGDVTSHEAVLWARGDAGGRLTARLSSGAHVGRVLHGPRVDESSDFTGRLDLTGLTPGREYEAALWFEGLDGTRGEVGNLTFRTAPSGRRGQSFVWTGDTAGQGWGINPDLGGMTGYAAMAATNPDFFVHAGDTIYADGEIQESVTEVDGQVWRNVVTPEVSKVAESLAEYRGRHKYNLTDHNVRSLYVDVPVVPQWDDHETHNNWYPGQVLDDPRYTERNVDVLAARARRAWQEFQPIRSHDVHQRGHDGFATDRIYRKIERGPLLDVFCLDMRTFKGPNTKGLEKEPTHIFGAEQTDWLIREVSRSRATWKVISADLPLGLVVPDGAAQESLSNGDPGAPLGRELELAQVLRGFRDHGVRNVVWITADVHYCAAHHYDPSRAAFTDFDPFWEIVAGPINAGAFGPNALDGTFGPRVEFQKVADYPNQSPRTGNQFFGHVAIDGAGELTVSLRNARGSVLWRKELQPGRR
jgi:alkaline phosphatase D